MLGISMLVCYYVDVSDNLVWIVVIGMNGVVMIIWYGELFGGDLFVIVVVDGVV